MAMRMTAGYGIKMMWRGEQVARLDSESCVNCNACVRVCPFGAIAGNGQVAIHTRECWGCGICRNVCRRGAITLVDRSAVPDVADLW